MDFETIVGEYEDQALLQDHTKLASARLAIMAYGKRVGLCIDDIAAIFATRPGGVYVGNKTSVFPLLVGYQQYSPKVVGMNEKVECIFVDAPRKRVEEEGRGGEMPRSFCVDARISICCRALECIFSPCD